MDHIADIIYALLLTGLLYLFSCGDPISDKRDKELKLEMAKIGYCQVTVPNSSALVWQPCGGIKK